ncbi:MAG: calcium-binding protein [Pseudomonadota bacterium]
MVTSSNQGFLAEATLPSESVFGTERTISGTLNDDRMRFDTSSASGPASNDLIRGYDGNDTINGGRGDDWVSGGEGDDVLGDYAGNDHLFGEGGNDRLNGRQNKDWLDGGTGNDYLRGGNGRDTLLGGSGNDTLDGGNGADTMLGGGNGDEMSGGSGRDSVDGGGGNDSLQGGDGNDTLIGSRGDDTLEGGGGGDILIGGEGADVFLFTSAEDSIPGRSGRKLLYDEIRAPSDSEESTASAFDAEDIIDLSALDADQLQDDDQAFAWGGILNSSTRSIGTLYLRERKGETMLLANTDDDESWELKIEIEDGTRELLWYDSANFIL